MQLISLLICLLFVATTWQSRRPSSYKPAPPLTAREYAEKCSEASGNRTATCAIWAANEKCFGEQFLATMVRQWCECECDLNAYDRIQRCCRTTTSGKAIESCYDLCRFNVTAKELHSLQALRCMGLLPNLRYCVWEGDTDGAALHCCRRKNVPSSCQFLCSGKHVCVAQDLAQLRQTEHCLEYLPQFQECELELLTQRPSWQEEWRSPC